jgi:uncharacterized integral membrane protein
MSRIVSLVILLLVLVLGLAFHLRNAGFVELDFYAGVIALPFSLWMFLALLTGACLGILAWLPIMLRLRRANARLARQVETHQRELDNLRVMPVREPM